MMVRMKEREVENARHNKMYVEQKLKAEMVTEALAKSRRLYSQDFEWAIAV